MKRVFESHLALGVAWLRAACRRVFEEVGLPRRLRFRKRGTSARKCQGVRRLGKDDPFECASLRASNGHAFA